MIVKGFKIICDIWQVLSLYSTQFRRQQWRIRRGMWFEHNRFFQYKNDSVLMYVYIDSEYKYEYRY